jgi:hypothetical protein
MEVDIIYTPRRRPLPWSDGEIVRNWIECGKTKEQVKVLAQLNCCTFDRIMQVLNDAGYGEDDLCIGGKPAPKCKKHKWADCERRLLVQMRVDGYTWKQIDVTFNRINSRAYAADTGLLDEIERKRSAILGGAYV